MAEKTEFAKVLKDGVVLEVHPTAVESHKSAGWSVTEAVVLATLSPPTQYVTQTTPNPRTRA